MEHEHELSFEQAAVVSFGAGSGHMLVLARPGSGKTHTLAARAKRLLNDGAEPRQMLAMTFSNRAANHLKDRLPAGGIWAGTFHAVCADILEQFGSVIGVRWPFRILDEVRAREFLLRAITELGVPLPHDTDGVNAVCESSRRASSAEKTKGWNESTARLAVSSVTTWPRGSTKRTAGF